MAKKKRMQKQQPVKLVVSSDAAETVEVTTETVMNSQSESEFEARKEQLFSKLTGEIDEYEKRKKDAEEAAEKAKSMLEELNSQKQLASEEKKKAEQELNAVKAELEKARNDVSNAEQEASSIRSDAESYAETLKQNAEKEKMSKIAEAAEEAKKAWQKESEDLLKQHSEIAEEQRKIASSKRELEKEKLIIEDEKEAIKDTKEMLASSKARYESANPAKISALETDLEDAKNKYTVLKEKYQALSERHDELQVIMDTVKTEIDDSENGIHTASMNQIVSNLQKLKEKHDRLASIYEKYPDDSAIARLEEEAKNAEKLRDEKERMELERDRFREEASAARNAVRELEVIKREAEATSALNEHLLKELESHKTALESRTGDTCPALTKVDTETEDEQFKADISARKSRAPLKTLAEVVSHVKNYAGSRKDSEQLFYTDNDIRAFLAGMAVSRLIILQGMSGTGKSSLPRIFAESVSGFNRLIPVESSWRDRNELLGYYNDFNKKFNAKSFTIELYRSSKKECLDVPTFIVLDEMNLARIEYYFSDFLAVLQEPDHSKWLIELVSSDMRTLPMELPDEIKKKMRDESPDVYSVWKKIEKARQGDLNSETSDDDKEILMRYLDKLGALTGAKNLVDGRKIKVADNTWFIGTANRDESTFEISDKVYDRAQVISLNKKGKSEGDYKSVEKKFITVTELNELFENAVKTNKHRNEVEDRLNKIDTVLTEYFDMSFGNRIVTQTVNFTAVFTAAGGKLDDALDYQISTKILRKVINTDDEESLLELKDVLREYAESCKIIDKRLKELR